MYICSMNRWTLQDLYNKNLDVDLKNGVAKKKKYGNTKVEKDGSTFDSKHESNFYSLLKLHNINFTMKEVFVLQEKFRYNGELIREIKIIPDFIIKKNGQMVAIVDTKGMITPDSKLKFKMLKKYLYDNGFNIPVYLPTNKKTSQEVITKLLHEIQSAA